MQWKNIIPYSLIFLATLSPEDKLAASLKDIDLNNPPHGLFLEEWMEIYLSGSKVGYAHYSLVRKGDDIHSMMQMRMQFNRGPITLKLETDQGTVESIDGEPKKFTMRTTMAGIPVVKEGVIAGGKVSISTRQLEMNRKEEYDWPSGALMTWGVNRETLKRGYAPGTSYTLDVYSPDMHLNKAVSSNVEVGDKEIVNYRGHAQTASKLITTVNLDLGDITTHSWVDEMGVTVKSSLQFGGMQVLMFATDEITALTDFLPADLFTHTLLTLDQSIPEDAKAVIYRLSLKNKQLNPLLLPDTYCQKVLENNEREILLRIGGHDVNDKNEPMGESLIDSQSAYLNSNSYISTEDDELIDMAYSIAGINTEKLDLASQLREFTTHYITDKTLSVGFASASEVARNPSGDCTEHAVFLAALGRIRGIPARVASGLAYIPEYLGKKNVLGYHMWTQFYLEGRWIDYDAALKTSDCSPTRIAVYTSSLEDNNMADFAFALMDMIGQLDVSIDSVVY